MLSVKTIRLVKGKQVAIITGDWFCNSKVLDGSGIGTWAMWFKFDFMDRDLKLSPFSKIPTTSIIEAIIP